jgi:GcrA cell cycle regulator
MVQAMALDSVWNEALVNQLVQLWQAGLSTAEIGRRLGISKNAVVGKAHRLDLPARPSPIRNPVPRVRPEVRRPTPPPAEPRLAGLHAGPPGPPCQWPYGHPGQDGFHFCGQPSLPGKPYCPEHAARAYVGIKLPATDAAA